MREIKFRQWTGGGFRFWGVGVDNCTFIGPTSGRSFNAHNTTHQQFTGLRDRNGKEIYEGDIVVKNSYIWFDDGKPNYRGTVEWIYSAWQVVAHCINNEKSGISDGINEGLNDDGVDDGEISSWEVIGNIYENPELLK